LGPYVVLAMLLSGGEVALCLLALSDPQRKECELVGEWAKDVGIETWLHFQLGAGLSHLIFAPYIQTRVWQTMQVEATEAELLDKEKFGEGDPMMAPHMVGVSGKGVQEAFWHVVAYDLGVMAYFFVLVGSCIWSLSGCSWLAAAAPPEPWVMPWEEAPPALSPPCDPDGYVTAAAHLGVTFGLFVVFYLWCFSCYLCCCVPPVPTGEGMAYSVCTRTLPGKEPVVRTPWQRACAPGVTMKLLACLCLDALGDATYLLPGLDEEVDFVYAPAMSIALKMMFRYSALPGLGFTEEILPFTDAIPTATIGWFLDVFSPDSECARCIGIRSDENP